MFVAEDREKRGREREGDRDVKREKKVLMNCPVKLGVRYQFIPTH